jgi:hypothetical protein
MGQPNNGDADGRLGSGMGKAQPGQSAEGRDQAAVAEKQWRTKSGHEYSPAHEFYLGLLVV